jgi:hypothetical protein
MRYSRSILTSLVVFFVTLGALPSTASAASCQFVLGFQTLQQLIPNQVGSCLDNQAYAANGDALQHTTGPTGAGGLLVWRKADNWTAYTDGYHTWINGPYGVQERLNAGPLFPWEAPATCTKPDPNPYNVWLECRTDALSLDASAMKDFTGRLGAFFGNASVVRDSAWQSAVKADLASLRLAGTEFQTAPANSPSDLAAADSLYASMGTNIINACNDIETGIDSGNLSTLTNGFRELGNVGQLSAISAVVDPVFASHGYIVQ